MGLYDRDYVREERRTWRLPGGRTVVTSLIVLNLVLFFVDYICGEIFGRRRLFDWMMLKPDLFTHPWNAWQLITYGFAHEHSKLLHVAFNMFGLWFFGREVEQVYGPREFLRIYLSLLAFSGLVWVAGEAITSGDAPGAVGASGAVMGVMILFVMHFPRQEILFWGVLPMPAWVLAIIFVVMDISGTIHSQDNVGHTAHLGGALFGFIYYRAGWNFGRLLPSGWFSRMTSRRRLRVHRPDDEPANLASRVDRILEKISREGESSLTADERRTLEEASRRYQRRRQ